jgi:hypothetical protein
MVVDPKNTKVITFFLHLNTSLGNLVLSETQNKKGKEIQIWYAAPPIIKGRQKFVDLEAK